jgi:hypothetical protein
MNHPPVSDDVLIHIFERVPDDRPWEWGKELHPLLTVCRQWNVCSVLLSSLWFMRITYTVDSQTAVKSIFYRNIKIKAVTEAGHYEQVNIHALLDSLKASKARGHDWSSSVRTLQISAPFPCLHQVQWDLKDFLSHTCLLTNVDLWRAPDCAIEVISEKCAGSLPKLAIREGPWQLDLVSKFQNLRKLSVSIYDHDSYPQLEMMSAWELPFLEQLDWDEPDDYGQPRVRLEAIRFLAWCRFPRLRKVNFRIEVDEDDGPGLLRRFLEVNSTIEDLSLVMNADTYSVVLPVVKATQLGLQSCGNVSSSLIKLLPPTVEVLHLPVFFDGDEDSGSDDEDEHEDIEDVLYDLRHARTNIKKIHVSLGHRYSDRYLDDNLIEWMTSPVYFGRQESNRLKTRLVVLGLLYQSAVELSARGITIHDERGMTFKDYL